MRIVVEFRVGSSRNVELWPTRTAAGSRDISPSERHETERVCRSVSRRCFLSGSIDGATIEPTLGQLRLFREQTADLAPSRALGRQLCTASDPKVGNCGDALSRIVTFSNFIFGDDEAKMTRRRSQPSSPTNLLLDYNGRRRKVTKRNRCGDGGATAMPVKSFSKSSSRKSRSKAAEAKPPPLVLEIAPSPVSSLVSFVGRLD